MKRFITLLLLFFYFFGNAQNLIPNPGADDYIFCPTQLGGGNQTFPGVPWVVDDNIFPWKSWRNSPDYFNVCANNNEFPSGSTNPLGFQETLSGSGYTGFITFHPGLTNYREFIGLELPEHLVVGQTYQLNYFISTAFEYNVSTRASNNVGILLMESFYLDPGEFGDLPNFAHFTSNEIVSDTTNWVEFSVIFTADSNYRYLAFGNFFDDSLTDNEILFDGEVWGMAYYYLENVCLIPVGGDCTLSLANSNRFRNELIKIFPNPTSNQIFVDSQHIITKIDLIDVNGRIIDAQKTLNQASALLNIDNLNPGIYILRIRTEEEVEIMKRIVVTK